ncbi:hypothetical protein INS49_001371 [Diaporthe citri]|uniref:uncharacterized protein n=1 Tax=Diaporthe citri TaxID=83186 RepID=UPI001C8092EE|nr:uncharacterized protein INS49_001371 [Diaporthe citri]KAG6367186.1 hypothetical protein INS49_001371 [Diaporthe citri]
MFSPSALGGSICLRCQVRAVARRAPPLLAAAQVRGRRRQYASSATASRPGDFTPVAEIKEHGRETEQRLGGLSQPQLDETSPSVVAEQTLPDSPRDAPKHALDLPDGSVANNHVLHDIKGNIERDQEPRADVDLLESAATSEPDYRAEDRKDEWKTNQEEGLSVGQHQKQDLSKEAGAPANRTCPHCRKVFLNKASLDDHTNQGCASLKPPRDLKCSKCQEVFEKRRLLNRHVAKRSCSAKAEPEKLAGNEDDQKLENILSQAAADFSRRKASGTLDPTFDDDWSLPQRQEAHHQAATANHEPDKSAREYRTEEMEVNIHTDPEMNNEKNDTVGTEPAIREDSARVRDQGDTKRAEKDSDAFQIRKIGQAMGITRGRKKEHRRGDMVLVEDASKLGVLSFGKAAEVIVLRDGRQWARRAAPVEASSEENTDSGLKIEEFLDEQDVLSLDDVVKNIHGLKPERQIMSAREFKSLFSTLMDGFTILQLEKYVVWHREQSILERIKDEVFDENETPSEEPTIPEDVLPKRREYGWLTEQAHWTPYVDGAVEEAQYPLAGYIMKKMPPKQRLVVQLMRECWDISMQELLDGNGRVDIRVRDLEFKLLTLGSQKPLQRISWRFLKEGQQIEVRRSSNLIRITAPKPVAETCVHALGETLQKIKTKTFKLDQVPMQRLDAGILEELGRITNSVVQFGPDREAIHVTWLDFWDKESQLTLENIADMTYRLLLTARTSSRISNNLTVYPDVEGNGRLLEDHSNKEKLSWTDRRKEWARLCLPLTSKQPRTAKSWPLTTDALQFKLEPTEEDLALPTSTYQSKLDNFYQTVSPIGLPRLEEEQPKEQTSAQEPEATDATPSGWRPFKTTTNAAFGHVLHLNEPKLTENIARPNISTNLASWPRTFVPFIPPVAELDLPGWTPYDGAKDRASTILMRFVPSPTTPAIHSLRAINRTSISDILLPAEHVDVRTTQHEYAELPSATIDSTEGMEPLREFLNNSRLEISQGKLVTPPRLHNLGLPRWLLAPPLPSFAAANTTARAGKKKAAAAKARPPQHLPHTPEGNEIRRASYVFAGLEWHHAVETTYDGWKLVYTSIEAGAGGGRRAELSLEAVPGYDVDLRRSKEAINATFFLRSIYQLATGQAGHLVQRAGGEEQVRTTVSWVR